MSTAPIPLRLDARTVRRVRKVSSALRTNISALIRFAVETELKRVERGELLASGAKRKRGTCVDAFRAPTTLLDAAKAKAKAEDISFSQLMRRALKRELEAAR